jgi:hypothetical protein
MTDQHPITPPPELIKQWVSESNHNDPLFAQVAVMAARWGADQELEACVEHLKNNSWAPNSGIKLLRAARRPKPPSLKEQAHTELDRLIALIPTEGAIAMAEPLRRALEALPK